MKKLLLKKLALFVVIVCFFACDTPNDNVVNNVPCYYVFTANDSLNTCPPTNPNHQIFLNWGAGTHQMTNKSTYTTSIFMQPSGLNANLLCSVVNLNKCNSIKVDFYVDGLLIDSQTVQLGYQNDCITYCSDGTQAGLTFILP